MRWLCLALLAGVLVCGCGPAVEQASAPAGPVVEAGTPALAGPSAVGRARGYQPDRRIRGRVTGVDPKLGLVVLDVGEADGVRERYAFTVYRGESYVGRVVVSQVFPDYCAARYSRDMRADVAVGDEAATRLAVEF